MLTMLAVGACSSRPIPLIAVQGTTFVLPLPMYSGYGGDMPFGSVLAGSTERADRQRGELVVGLCPDSQPACASPQYYLVTRYVTSLVPDPASPAALLWPQMSQVYGAQPIYSSQALALLEVPDSVAPNVYALQVRRRAFGSAQGVDETVLADIDPGNITIVARPTNVPDPAWNPLETRFGTFGMPVAPDLLKFIPYPSVAVRLSDARSQDPYFWPAAAEFEVSYPVGILIKGVFEEKSPGRGSVVLVRDDSATRTLHISFIDPRRCTPSLRIAYDWDAGRATPVLATEFAVVEANTRTYSLAGVAHSSPTGSVVVRDYAINAGVMCAEPAS